jgi:hypothetical protein
MADVFFVENLLVARPAGALRVAAEVTPGVRAVNEHVLIRPASYGM